jgi:hypothetical protein
MMPLAPDQIVVVAPVRRVRGEVNHVLGKRMAGGSGIGYQWERETIAASTGQVCHEPVGGDARPGLGLSMTSWELPVVTTCR